MRVLAVLLPLVLAHAPVLAAQLEHAPQPASVTGEFGTGSPLLQPHPLRSQGLPLGFWPAPLQSTELVSPEGQRARLSPMKAAKRGALIGGAIGGAVFGGLTLLAVTSDGDLTGEDAAHVAVYTVGNALNGAIVGFVIGIIVGTVRGS